MDIIGGKKNKKKYNNIQHKVKVNKNVYNHYPIFHNKDLLDFAHNLGVTEVDVIQYNGEWYIKYYGNLEIDNQYNNYISNIHILKSINCYHSTELFFSMEYKNYFNEDNKIIKLINLCMDKYCPRFAEPVEYLNLEEAESVNLSKYWYASIFDTIDCKHIAKEINESEEIVKKYFDDYKNKIVTEHNEYNLIRYHSTTDVCKTVVHNGQLKLLLSEVQYLVYVINKYNIKTDIDVNIINFNSQNKYANEFKEEFPEKHKELLKRRFEINMSQYDYDLNVIHAKLKIGKTDLVVIYAGSAPGVHIPLLCQMFPNILWILIDPVNAFTGLYHKELKTFVNQGLYSNEFYDELVSIKEIAQLPKVFISDIRTNNSDLGVYSDNIMQNKWLHYMFEHEFGILDSMIKFRLPFDINIKTVFLSGKCVLQKFQGETSTETRLYSCKDDIDIEYNYEIYESILFTYNHTMRLYRYDLNEKYNKYIGYFGLCPCNDCVGTIKIILDYCDIIKETDVDKIKEFIKHIYYASGRRGDFSSAPISNLIKRFSNIQKSRFQMNGEF